MKGLNRLAIRTRLQDPAVKPAVKRPGCGAYKETLERRNVRHEDYENPAVLQCEPKVVNHAQWIAHVLQNVHAEHEVVLLRFELHVV